MGDFYIQNSSVAIASHCRTIVFVSAPPLCLALTKTKELGNYSKNGKLEKIILM